MEVSTEVKQKFVFYMIEHLFNNNEEWMIDYVEGGGKDDDGYDLMISHTIYEISNMFQTDINTAQKLVRVYIGIMDEGLLLQNKTFVNACKKCILPI